MGRGGPAQTYIVNSLRRDGWVLVEVADENTNPAYLVPGELPTRWRNVGIAIFDPGDAGYSMKASCLEFLEFGV